MKLLPKPIAIRSLACADHAHHIPPKVLSVLWFVGKRCNYDCSYCSPHSHDSVSPYLDLHRALNFADQVQVHCEQNDKKIKWAFSGGEPFIDPNFIKMCRYIHGLGRVEQMNVVTNGSLPLKLYQQAAEIFSGITFSLHLERDRSEIDKTINLISNLRKSNPKLFLNCDIMYLPGNTQWIRNIMAVLDENDIQHVLRKITPPLDSKNLLPYVKSDEHRKSIQLLDINEQSKRKYKSYVISDIGRKERLLQYYTATEEEFFYQHSQKTPWQNTGVWADDGTYREVHSDQLVMQNQNQFLGWTCYAGVDNIYVDFDGKIYRGFCLEGGAISMLGNDKIFADSPIVCQRQWCNCTYDIPVRKISHMNHAALIKHQN